MNPNTMTVAQRLAAPTPKFFKTLRTIGMIAGAVSGAIVTLVSGGIGLPAGIVAIATAVHALVTSLPVDTDI